MEKSMREPLCNKNIVDKSMPLLKSSQIVINTGELGLGKVSISKDFIKEELNKRFINSFELKP